MPLGIIGLFVIGVFLGARVRRRAKKAQSTAVLTFVCAALLVAALCHEFGFGAAAIIFMVLAMGAENNVFVRDGEVSIGVTYMTGTLVKLGQQLEAGAAGATSARWTPYLLLWQGLVIGALAGAELFKLVGLSALWLAVGIAGSLCATSRKIED